MENTLRETSALTELIEQPCLNPCFNGKCPQSMKTNNVSYKEMILMENALRV